MALAPPVHGAPVARAVPGDAAPQSRRGHGTPRHTRGAAASRHARRGRAARILAQGARRLAGGRAATRPRYQRATGDAARSAAPDLADDLPDEPGVYRFFGASEPGEDTLLYVGEANNLRE